MSKYFLQELEQDPIITNIFLPDIEYGVERYSIALKLWSTATIAAKSTRETFVNSQAGEGEQAYNIQQRRSGFKEADRYAGNDEVSQAGVEVATILELILRKKRKISLEGAEFNSPVRKYLKDKNKDIISESDLAY